MQTTLSRRLMAGLLILLPGAAAAPLPEERESLVPQTHRYIGKERVDLEVDLTRILVRAAAGSPVGDLLRSVHATGIEVASIDSLGAPDWHFLVLAAASASPATVRASIDALLTSPYVDFGSPVVEGLYEGAWGAMTEQVLVRFNELPSQPAVALPSDLDLVETDAAGLPRLVRLRSRSCNGFDVLAQANALALRPDVEYAEPDMLCSVEAHETPDDPFFYTQWGANNTNPNEVDMDIDVAWDSELGSGFAPILIMDGGFDVDHPDLSFAATRDFTCGSQPCQQGGAPVNPCDRHGTWVAGCTSGIMDNGIGVAGLAAGSPVFGARVFDADVTSPCGNTGSASGFHLAMALDWGEQNGCRVSNTSLALGVFNQTLANKYQTTRWNGMVHFASAGNNGTPVVLFPAWLADVNSVAAIERTGALWSMSSYGTGLDFVGPGVHIATTNWSGGGGGDYTYVQGTSFASPYVAALASLVISKSTSAVTTPTAAEVETILRDSCLDLGAPGLDTTFGHGLPQGSRALLAPGLELYGTGNSGCSGLQTHWAVTAPIIGAPLWPLTCNNAPPNTPGLLMLSTQQDVSGTWLYGGLFHVGSGNFFAVTSDADGQAAWAPSIPLDPSLVGTSIYTQFLWSWPTGGSCTVVSEPYGWSTSNGMKSTFQ